MQELLNFVFLASLVGLYLSNRALRRQVEELRQFTGLLLRQQRKADTEPLPTPEPLVRAAPSADERAAEAAIAAPAAPPLSPPPLRPSAGFPSLDQLAAAYAGQPSASSDPDFLRPDRKKSNAELEQFIGGNLFSKLGVLALVIAGGLFLSYAFENNLVSETMRCVIGFVVGGLSLGFAHWSHRKGLAVFSQALVALGVSVLYLTVYAMAQFYSLVPDGVATVLTLGVCVLTAGLALHYRSEPIAIMAALGAYLTPVLLGDASATAVPLLDYLLLVALAVSALVWLRAEWVWLRPVPIVGTLVLTSFWYAENSVNSLGLEASLCYLLWALFLAYDVLHRVVDPRRAHAVDLVAAALNGLYAVVITVFLTESASEFWQSLCSGTVAALYAALAFSTHDRLSDDSKPVLQTWLGTFALLAMGAVFVVAEDYPGVAVVTVVGLVFFFAARAAALKTVTPAMGMFLVTSSLVLLILGDDAPEPDWFIVNTRTLAYALLAGSWLAVGLTPTWTEGKKYLLARSVAGIAAVLLGFMWLNFEMEAGFDRWMPYDYETADTRSNWMELTRSALWMLYSLLLFAVGMVRSSVAPRYASIVLFGVTILKIFLSDLSFLDTPYRIASFMVLGLILLLVSFIYQRYRHVIFGTPKTGTETNSA